jgi:hypothetical protein
VPNKIAIATPSAAPRRLMAVDRRVLLNLGHQRGRCRRMTPSLIELPGEGQQIEA